MTAEMQADDTEGAVAGAGSSGKRAGQQPVKRSRRRHAQVLEDGVDEASAPVVSPCTRWTVSEDDALIAAVMDGHAAGHSRPLTYAAAVSSLTGRTSRAIEERVKSLVKLGRLPPAPIVPIACSWTASDDDVLIAGVLAGDAAGHSRKRTYTSATSILPGRTAHAIKHQVQHLVKLGRLPPSPTGILGFGWTASEDDALIAAVLAGDAAGHSRMLTFAAATNILPGRTSRAIKDRVKSLVNLGRLPPAPTGIMGFGWTVSEDDALIAAVLAGDAVGHSRKLAYAAATIILPDRTSHAIKHRAEHLIKLDLLPPASGIHRDHTSTAVSGASTVSGSSSAGEVVARAGDGEHVCKEGEDDEVEDEVEDSGCA